MSAINHNDMPIVQRPEKNASSRSVKKFIFAIAAILIGVVIFEAGLHIAQFFFQFNKFKSERDWQLDLRAASAAYRGKDWAKPYYDELKLMNSTIDPLVGWRPQEFHGTYMNVDADGMRKTWNPATSTTSSKVITVFMFGGSTMLGAGTPDGYTIPSYVSRMLNEHAPPGTTYLVRNYGQSGYVLVQEIAKLTLLLERGERPDYVIFYDGANDTAYSYQSGIPGIAGSLGVIGDQFRERLDASTAGQFWTWIKDTVKASCFSCRLAFDAIRGFDPSFLNPNVIVGQSLDDAAIAKLAREVAGEYQNHTLGYLRTLENGFRFKLLTFWQPTIYTESKIVGDEAHLDIIDPHVDDPTAKKLFVDVNHLLPSDPVLHFYNISDAFAGRTHEYYIDYTHVSDEGDAAVAQRIVGAMQSY